MNVPMKPSDPRMSKREIQLFFIEKVLATENIFKSQFDRIPIRMIEPCEKSNT
jgi:hypothetical protein